MSAYTERMANNSIVLWWGDQCVHLRYPPGSRLHVSQERLLKVDSDRAKGFHEGRHPYLPEDVEVKNERT